MLAFLRLCLRCSSCPVEPPVNIQFPNWNPFSSSWLSQRTSNSSCLKLNSGPFKHCPSYPLTWFLLWSVCLWVVQYLIQLFNTETHVSLNPLIFQISHTHFITKLYCFYVLNSCQILHFCSQCCFQATIIILCTDYASISFSLFSFVFLLPSLSSTLEIFFFLVLKYIYVVLKF